MTSPAAASAPSPSSLETALRSAVLNDELILAYQPEFELETMRVTAVEALVRWMHPTFGELGPEWFIRTAERSDLIQEVGAWVIDKSVRQLSVWLAQLPQCAIVLRVNVSPVQVAGGDIVAPVANALRDYGVAGDRVCVELTESARMSDVDSVAGALSRLAHLGVSSAIDDIATGYNTLSTLRRLRFDVMKLDRSLVTGIDGDLRAQAIVRALIDLAGSLDMGVTGEGVETDAEVDMLLELGCTRAQGHLLAKPMDDCSMLQLLRRQ